jgi:hypothetical protein
MSSESKKILFIEKKMWVKAGLGLLAIGIIGSIFL